MKTAAAEAICKSAKCDEWISLHLSRELENPHGREYLLNATHLTSVRNVIAHFYVYIQKLDAIAWAKPSN